MARRSCVVHDATDAARRPHLPLPREAGAARRVRADRPRVSVPKLSQCEGLLAYYPGSPLGDPDEFTMVSVVARPRRRARVRGRLVARRRALPRRGGRPRRGARPPLRTLRLGPQVRILRRALAALRESAVAPRARSAVRTERFERFVRAAARSRWASTIASRWFAPSNTPSARSLRRCSLESRRGSRRLEPANRSRWRPNRRGPGCSAPRSRGEAVTPGSHWVDGEVPAEPERALPAGAPTEPPPEREEPVPSGTSVPLGARGLEAELRVLRRDLGRVLAA